MSTQSSCFSWNPSTNNGTCHGVSYSSRFNATPAEDVAEGKAYFMHYPENDPNVGTTPPNYFNFTYMNTYIPDTAPNTSDCLFCHNQSNATIRQYWGSPIQVKLNSTGGYDPDAMFGATDLKDCYNCHVSTRVQPKNFHNDEMNPGLACHECHFNLTTMTGLGNPEYWINESLFNTSVHGTSDVFDEGNFGVGNLLYCNKCHTMTAGHPPPESRWKWCEDCHVVMPKYANGTPIKEEQQRHNMTYRPQFNMVNDGGVMRSVVNVTDCTLCHDETIYNTARSVFNRSSGKDCRYCHSFPDLEIDSPY
jgi:hypothetical protein